MSVAVITYGIVEREGGMEEGKRAEGRRESVKSVASLLTMVWPERGVCSEVLSSFQSSFASSRVPLWFAETPAWTTRVLS